jgi:hypothetical protein
MTGHTCGRNNATSLATSVCFTGGRIHLESIWP